MFFCLFLTSIYYTPEMIKVQGTIKIYTIQELLRLDEFDENTTRV